MNKPALKKPLAGAGIELVGIELVGIELVGIELVGNEITSITWFNGIVLWLAAERDIEAIGLFGEISETAIPQPLAAKSILSAFSRLENIALDIKKLDRHYESILEEMQSKKEPTKFGPGIG